MQADSSSLQTQLTSENTQIAAEQVRITDLQTNLQSELSQADAAIASLQLKRFIFSSCLPLKPPTQQHCENRLMTSSSGP